MGRIERIRRNSTAIAFCLFLLVFLAGCVSQQKSNALKELKQAGVLMVGASGDYQPMSYLDPNTASYNKFLHLGRQIDSSNIDRYKKIFKSRKDKYRRWRDLSFFVMVGVYAISVIDAYVDAELSEFDISKDLSMKVRPTIMGNGMTGNPLYATSLGVNCSVNF